MLRRIAEMGEVRVDVRLTNLLDEALARRGQLDEEKVRSGVYSAVVDTGAVMSVLPQSVVDELGLDVIRKVRVCLADGKDQEVGVVYNTLFDIQDRQTGDEAYVLGDEVLIGQTVLEKLDLLVDCTHQILIGRHPDGPLHRV